MVHIRGQQLHLALQPLHGTHRFETVAEEPSEQAYQLDVVAVDVDL